MTIKSRSATQAQQPAAPPPMTTKENTACLLGADQCSSLLPPASLPRPDPPPDGGIQRHPAPYPPGPPGRRIFVFPGFAGEYTMIRAGRTTRAAALWLAAAFLAAWHQVAEIRLPRGPYRPAGAVRPHLCVLPGHPQHLGSTATPSGGKKASGGRHRRRHRLSGPGQSPAMPGCCPGWWSTSCPWGPWPSCWLWSS